jgi:hypothetical protein
MIAYCLLLTVDCLPLTAHPLLGPTVPLAGHLLLLLYACLPIKGEEEDIRARKALPLAALHVVFYPRGGVAHLVRVNSQGQG